MKSNENIQINYSTWSLIKDLGVYIKPYRGRFVFGTLLRLTGDLVNLYPSIAMASVVTFLSKYSAGMSLGSVWYVFWLMVAALACRAVTVYWSKNIIYQISEKTALDASLVAMKHLFVLDMVWHEKENAGNKIKKIHRGASGIDRVIRMWVNNYIEIIVNFVGVVYILWRSDGLIGAGILFFMVTYFTISFLSLRKVFVVVKEINEKEEEIGGLHFQAINNIRSVKVSGISEKLFKMMKAQVDNIFIIIKKRIALFQIRGVLLSFWSIIFRAVSMAFIIYGIIQGVHEVGFLILFFGYFGRVQESVSELANITQDLIINKLAIGRMQEIINEPIMIDDEKDKVDFPKNWKKITVNNLSFAYGEHQVLKNISFEINKGERVGIIGLSGAGKTTLFKLLLKENENFTGDILFDNVSLKDIKKSSYLKKMGVVLQDTEVFNFTLRENITIAADDDFGDKELRQALDISHVTDFVDKLPNGIDTTIGEKGIKLSGGEKQRLGIARAIYKKPQVLFMDEATSHLDLESEEKIKDSLHKFFQKVTAIVIAHRLTTIKEMDKILVIEQGRLVESGNFNELYKKKGRFFELWEKQKL